MDVNQSQKGRVADHTHHFSHILITPKMRTPHKLLATLVTALALTLGGCHGIEEFNNDNIGNFEALWTALDQHYCFFKEKGIDWNEVHDRYAARIHDKMQRREFFDLCAAMLDELRDGHTNLSSPFATSYYRAWWSDYPQNYDARLIQQHYFNFKYISLGAIDYGLLLNNIGYMHYSTFASSVGEGNMDYIMLYFAGADGLIIDVRDNGGGDLTNVESFVNRFIGGKTLAGYMMHKTGPGHNDFSRPEPFYYYPAGADHYGWAKPVVILTNRSTYSAANNFVSIMKNIPGVTIIGATTGGGSGMPYNSELPNGWSVRFSACPILDALGNPTEFGVEPTEGFAVDMDPLDALQGRDTILDTAIEFLTSPQ